MAIAAAEGSRAAVPAAAIGGTGRRPQCRGARRGVEQAALPACSGYVRSDLGGVSV
jgi:hypothetical protein